ncbi:MAG: hypothetical protein IPK82_36070 [Polyangiaceae bacterium]|nr:hypothetical protein [Polyangiaceae bacterium]
MNPYRINDESDSDAVDRSDDESAVLWLVFGVGIMPPVYAAVQGSTWEPSPLSVYSLRF